ncbi:MAG: hypothetical protein CMH61_02365 [Nanoarchaeota archaeon]|nr:hypothetical protein [Nanoarchaeota archaeon]|tara:strand:+ start:563 stop:907 length:345 start_codon:yes stop_codon:yes gene_type:complete
MTQNRNKLIQLFIGNVVNVVVHRILERATQEEILRKRYDKESLVSFNVAQRYRNNIHPVQRELPEHDKAKIREEVIRRVKNELHIRISKEYKGINLQNLESTVDKVLQELLVGS